MKALCKWACMCVHTSLHAADGINISHSEFLFYSEFYSESLSSWNFTWYVAACADAYLTPCIKKYVSSFSSGFKESLKVRSVLYTLQWDEMRSAGVAIKGNLGCCKWLGAFSAVLVYLYCQPLYYFCFFSYYSHCFFIVHSKVYILFHVSKPHILKRFKSVIVKNILVACSLKTRQGF